MISLCFALYRRLSALPSRPQNATVCRQAYFSAAARHAVVALTLAVTSGCATVESGFQAMNARLDAVNAKNIARDLQDFPDQALRSVFVGSDGRPSGKYECMACGIYDKAQAKYNERYAFDFILIDRTGPRVHDQQALAAFNTSRPLESLDVGKLFIENARARGNYISVYGPAVNDRILRLLNPPEPRTQNYWYASDLSSCLVERDASGGFISILAASFELSYGVIRSDSAESKDVFTNQRLFVFPRNTARYVQERLGTSFTENHRVRE